MRSLENLTRPVWVSIVLVSIGALAAQRAGAVPLHQNPHQKEIAPPLVQLAGRKGARDYKAGEADALTVPSGTETAPKRNSLEECMAIWDAGTHITKSKWREICQRQINERADMDTKPPAQAAH